MGLQLIHALGAFFLGIFLTYALYRYKKTAIGNKFKNKVVWITGASSGIGEALAIEVCFISLSSIYVYAVVKKHYV